MDEIWTKAFGLQGETALVTGGGSGLGFAMAKCFLAAGAKVVITGRREEVLQQACQELKAVSSQVYAYPFDVTATQDAAAFVQRVSHEVGPISILVNNAGIHCKKPVEAVTIDDLRGVLDVHLLGAYALTQAVLPGMRSRHKGSIIFVSSMSAYLAMTQVTAYSAAKSAVLGLVKTLSGEVAADGIRVNAIAPGFIDTPMFHQATDKDPARQKKILAHTPMACYGKPADVGWAAVFLAAEASGFVTGVCLPVDGGCCIGF